MSEMTNEIYWQAVKQNDKSFDGVFFTCVKSTGIYCRPSCTARLPKRVNVKFLESAETAVTNGFRACLRCKPDEIDFIDNQVKKIMRACQLIDDGRSESLEHLGNEVDLSPAHLQRTFKKIVGISPKKYAEQRRLERFRAGIRSGAEVTDAIYDAGFESSSRLYENASGKLGMTPAVYKKGGQGMTIDYAISDCDLGKLLVARTSKGICAVKFGDSDDELLDDLHEEFASAEITKNETRLASNVKAILAHLDGNNRNIDLPIAVQATAFQMQVWETLRRIPYGETLSYSEVAEKIGNKNAVRAVASACAKNKVAVVIPCHRVIGKDGKMSGYRWGIERKWKLLQKEKSLAARK